MKDYSDRNRDRMMFGNFDRMMLDHCRHHKLPYGRPRTSLWILAPIALLLGLIAGGIAGITLQAGSTKLSQVNRTPYTKPLNPVKKNLSRIWPEREYPR